MAAGVGILERVGMRLTLEPLPVVPVPSPAAFPVASVPPLALVEAGEALMAALA